MNIIVLAGGLSTERDVSFSTGEDVCKALRERGHQAAMLDVFLGYEGDVSEDFFVRNDAIRSDDKKIKSIDPDLDQIKQMREIARMVSLDRMFWHFAERQISYIWRCMAQMEKMVKYRQRSICLAFVTQVPAA